MSLNILVPAVPQPRRRVLGGHRDHPTHNLALHRRPRVGAAHMRAVVGSFRPASRDPRRLRSRHLRRTGRNRRDERRALIFVARPAGDRRRDRGCHRSRHHPRSVRARPRSANAELHRQRHGGRPYGRPAGRRPDRPMVRLAGDLPVRRFSVAAGVCLDRHDAAGNAPARPKVRAASLSTSNTRNSRRYIGYVLTAAFSCGAFFMFVGGGPHVIITMMQRTPTEYGVWFLAVSAGYILGNIITSRLSVRWGVDTMILWGSIVEIVGAVIGIMLMFGVDQIGPLAVIAAPALISHRQRDRAAERDRRRGERATARRRHSVGTARLHTDAIRCLHGAVCRSPHGGRDQCVADHHPDVPDHDRLHAGVCVFVAEESTSLITASRRGATIHPRPAPQRRTLSL